MPLCAFGRPSAGTERAHHHRTPTFSTDGRLRLVTLGYLIQTLMPSYVPSHTWAKLPVPIGSSPTLARSPGIVYEVGKIAWLLQMTWSLRRHRLEISSVIGVTPRT